MVVGAEVVWEDTMRLVLSIALSAIRIALRFAVATRSSHPQQRNVADYALALLRRPIAQIVLIQDVTLRELPCI